MPSRRHQPKRGLVEPLSRTQGTGQRKPGSRSNMDRKDCINVCCKFPGSGARWSGSCFYALHVSATRLHHVSYKDIVATEGKRTIQHKVVLYPCETIAWK
eukprot:523117-Amphidinium_carterae.1